MEENICASRRILEQLDFENHHLLEPDKYQYDSYFEQEDYESEADLEQQQACELLSDLESDSSVFANYYQDRYESGFYDQFANQDEPMITDDCIGNYMFSTDLYSYDVNPVLSSYFEHYSQKEILMIDDQDLIIREQEGSDQLLSLHFDLTKVEQSTFNIDINEGKDQQHKKVFPVGFYDSVANYLELISNIDIKIFLLEDGLFRHPSKLHCCMLGFHLFFGSRLGISSAD